MKNNELVLYAIYAISAAEGKVNPIVLRPVSKLLNISEEEVIGVAESKDLDSLLAEISKEDEETISVISTVVDFLAHVDKKLTDNEMQICNAINELLVNKEVSVKTRELTLLTIYAVAAADGKAGGGASTTIPKLLNMTEEAITDKTQNFDIILNEIKQLKKETISVITTIAYFIAYLDNNLHENEIKIIEKIEEL